MNNWKQTVKNVVLLLLWRGPIKVLVPRSRQPVKLSAYQSVPRTFDLKTIGRNNMPTAWYNSWYFADLLTFQHCAFTPLEGFPLLLFMFGVTCVITVSLDRRLHFCNGYLWHPVSTFLCKNIASSECFGVRSENPVAHGCSKFWRRHSKRCWLRDYNSTHANLKLVLPDWRMAVLNFDGDIVNAAALGTTSTHANLKLVLPDCTIAKA